MTPGPAGATPVTAFVALGANLSRPRDHVLAALQEINALPGTALIRCSSLYRTAPVGYLEQPDFVNAVAQIGTSLDPRKLLFALIEIEHRHGRTREFPNAPRSLDLDILLYGELTLNEPGLIIPHPRMHERAFVLQPLLEIAPQLVIPGRGRVAELAAANAGQRAEKLGTQ